MFEPKCTHETVTVIGRAYFTATFEPDEDTGFPSHISPEYSEEEHESYECQSCHTVLIIVLDQHGRFESWME